MKTQRLHSKLMDLQGETLSKTEQESILSQIFGVLDLRKAGQLTISEAGKKLRRLAWKVAEDLRIDGFALSTASDEELTKELPQLLKA